MYKLHLTETIELVKLEVRARLGLAFRSGLGTHLTNYKRLQILTIKGIGWTHMDIAEYVGDWHLINI